MSAPLDLAELARERMAREATKKRARDEAVSPPPSRKTPKLESSTITFDSGARLVSLSSVVDSQQRSRKSAVANTANARLRTVNVSLPTPPSTESTALPDSASRPPGSLAFPKGIVRKTWALGHPREGTDIKLEEVLEPLTLRTAVLSAFQWDPTWLLTKLRRSQTKCIFVMQAKTFEEREQIAEAQVENSSWLRFVFPSMENGVNCMHSKLMLLFHLEKLRIAVPTANLLDFDWGETGVMENSVWLIDLPRLPEGRKIEEKELTEFGKELMFFMRKAGYPQDVLDGVSGFDFAGTAGIAFVHTVGGMSYGADAERTGLPGLARAVRNLDLVARDIEIEFAASSIGSLNDEYLSHFHAAVSGEDMIARASSAASAAKANFFTAKKSLPSDHSIRDKIRIYFPTKETVQDSTAGAAGTICLNRKWFESMAFPRRCFRDYISMRPGLLSHNKILYARGRRKAASISPAQDTQEDSETEDEGETSAAPSAGKVDAAAERASGQVAWAYVGSSNMSESAWGKLVYDKKAKEWKVTCRNWECGVLIPVLTGKEANWDSTNDLAEMSVFDGVVKPPFMIPGVEYDGRKPWYFQEKH
ncbi:hypothetical protein B0A48_00251 [Cryoendolithus antarcticus]|uniref:PLD phosphodiesterase domain-containing protein n=1 Tax=Cryoendolithus antarcticus TaxID=1507870 RepID=A0A1V8TU60_9PEZI|nr:hypothetical protein B0A48_00251 [Cryoendolithus antarcticus]